MTAVTPDRFDSPPYADVVAVPPPAPPDLDSTPPATDHGPSAPQPRSWHTRLWRGRPDDPTWVRPTLLSLLAATGVLYLWGLSANGWANAFYSAAVQAGSQSWKAFLFGSSDAANFITVDKPPASLWIMEISARIFGVNSWSILVPQALMGVATVGLLYLAVRRVSSAGAGLIAGAVLAVTPVAVLMFRFNNPDAFLVLLLTAAAYATIRAIENGSRTWIIAVGVLVGFAFLTKSLQAFLPVPAFALAYLVAAPRSFGRRVVDLLLAGAALVVSAGWWVALVELWPASSRPYIGGSQTNSVWELIWGYNGLGRLSGNETGSVTPGGTGGAGAWGATGWDRLFTSSYGGQAAWLIPAALVLGVVLLVMTLRAPRTDRLRASAVIWLGWLLLTGLTISFAQGIIHEYYTVALAPAIGALVGLGAATLWSKRQEPWARITLALVLAGSAVWASVLLDRSASWYPWLRFAVLGLGVVSALAILVAERLTRSAAVAVAITGLAAVLLAPTAYSVQTALTAHSGSLPTAGPTVAGSRGGPGGGPGGGRGGFGPGGQTGTANGTQNGTPPTFGGQTGTGTGPGTGTGGMPQGGPGGTGGGGLLDASTPSAALVAALESDASSYTWAAATVGAQNAAGYQLATGLPVMALGGFNGSDPWPSLAVFQEYVKQHKIHYFIASGGFGGGGGNGGSSTTSEITSWVEQSYPAQTIGGTTVYDLSGTASTSSSTSGTGTTS
jgi:4-amino-4-deoxy-L-arabinose transferase-like glycosyltransferase